MKALFIKCYGKLTPDMLIGGLIDMGVPPVYLKSKLEEAGLPVNFIEKPNPKARVSAHYFHIPPSGEKPLLLKQGDIFRIWKEICTKTEPEWESIGWKVFSCLCGGASDAIDEIPSALPGVQFLLNTVPAPILGKEWLALVSPDAFLIELASPPYGIDLDAAKELGLHAWLESGIPGRYCPQSAAAALLRYMEQEDQP